MHTLHQNLPFELIQLIIFHSTCNVQTKAMSIHKFMIVYYQTAIQKVSVLLYYYNLEQLWELNSETQNFTGGKDVWD